MRCTCNMHEDIYKCNILTGEQEGKRPQLDIHRGVALTTHPHLAPRLKKEQSYTSTPPLGLRGLL